MNRSHLTLVGLATVVANNSQPAVDMVKAVEACGENGTACLMREAQQMTGVLQGPQNKARCDLIASGSRSAAAAMAPRFQGWDARAQPGRYEVEEAHRITEFGPSCWGDAVHLPSGAPGCGRGAAARRGDEQAHSHPALVF